MEKKMTKESRDRLMIVGAVEMIVEGINHDLLKTMAGIVFDEDDMDAGYGIADLKAIIKEGITDRMEKLTGLSLDYDQDSEETEGMKF